MNDDAQTALELFVEKTERLSRYVRENSSSRGLVVNPGGLVGVFREGEGGEWKIASTIEGFLATFRMFVQARDKIALYSLERDSQGQAKQQKTKLLDLTGLSADWYEQVEKAYSTIDRALAIAPPKLVYDDQPVTRREVLETFLYGDFVHASPVKRATLKRWQSQRETFGEFQLEFVSVVGFIFGQILEVAEACERELQQYGNQLTL